MDSDGDSEATRSQDDVETEDETEEYQARPAARPRLPRQESQLNSRSRATSPSADSGAAAAAGDEANLRLTARQRAKLEKEAGVATDVAWSEMELLPNLTYTWKGKGPKEGTQMTEQEWLKRQETLERRRMRSLRDKREAEEAVKAKIRRAVTARFRDKLGRDSGMYGQGPGGDQDGGFVRPGWVKMRYTAEGVTVAWHPAAHPLSLPVPVVAAPGGPCEPVDLPLQPSRPGEQWQAPPCSSSSFKAGCVLTLQPSSSSSTGGTLQQIPAGQQQQQQSHPQQQQQQQQPVVLQCVDSGGWSVGCLLQQQVLEALEFAGHWQPQQQSAGAGLGGQQLAAAAGGQQALDWREWRAMVKTIRRTADNQLAGVVVRLIRQQQLSC